MIWCNLNAPNVVIRATANDDEGCHEADDLELFAQFSGAPNLPMLGLKRFTAARLGVDLNETLAAERFGFINHAVLLDRVVELPHTDQAGVRQQIQKNWLDNLPTLADT